MPFCLAEGIERHVRDISVGFSTNLVARLRQVLRDSYASFVHCVTQISDFAKELKVELENARIKEVSKIHVLIS